MGTSVSPSERSPERNRGAALAAFPVCIKIDSVQMACSQHTLAEQCERKESARDASDILRRKQHVAFKKKIKVVKCSPVSTGQLKRLLALHHQPINLVVFQGALGPKSNET